MRHFAKLFLIIVLGAAALEVYRAYFFPGEYSHVISFLMWVVIGSFSSFLVAPWTSIRRYTETIMLPDSPESSKDPFEFKVSGFAPMAMGMLLITIASTLTFLPSYRVISDDALNVRHGMMWLVLGICCLTVRLGCRVSPTERRAERWFSILGIPFRTTVALSNDLQVVLRSVSWSPRTHRQLDTNGTDETGSLFSDVVLRRPEGDWVLCNGLSFEHAREVTRTLGLDSLVVEGELFHRGYDDRVKTFTGGGLETELDEERQKKRVLREQNAKIRRFILIASLPLPVMLVAFPLQSMLENKASQQQVVQVLATAAPPPLTREQKAEAPYRVAERAYKDSLKTDISQADRERFLREAIENINASMEIHVVEPQVYLLRAQIRCDLGMVSDALVDHGKFRELGGEGYKFAYNLRRAGLIEEALAVVEESLATRAPCESQVLKALLLFDLEREFEAVGIALNSRSCRGAAGWKELEEKMKSHPGF